MAGRKRGDIPGELARGRNRLEIWRRDRKVGARIPDRLWTLAVKLTETHDVGRTASTLKLENTLIANHPLVSVDGLRIAELRIQCPNR